MSVAGIVLAIIAIILSGCSDPSLEKALQQEQQMYCDMVKIGIESDGEYGWNDYNHNYSEVCK